MNLEDLLLIGGDWFENDTALKTLGVNTTIYLGDRVSET